MRGGGSCIKPNERGTAIEESVTRWIAMDLLKSVVNPSCRIEPLRLDPIRRLGLLGIDRMGRYISGGGEDESH